MDRPWPATRLGHIWCSTLWLSGPREGGGRLTLPAEGASLTCFLISLDLPCSRFPHPPASPTSLALFPLLPSPLPRVPGLQAKCGVEGGLSGPWEPISPPHRRSGARLGAPGSEEKELGSTLATRAWPGAGGLG